MKEKYIPGEGCQCSARCSCECGCDVDWTPREVYELREQRDRLAEALDVCLREMLDVIYACNEEIVDANDTFHQAIKLGQKTLDDVKGGSDD